MENLTETYKMYENTTIIGTLTVDNINKYNKSITQIDTSMIIVTIFFVSLYVIVFVFGYFYDSLKKKYDILYHEYEELKSQVTESYDCIILDGYDKTYFEQLVGTNISDSKWEKMCSYDINEFQDTINSTVVDWFSTKYNLKSNEDTSESEDDTSDSDYVPSETGSETEDDESDSDISDSELKDLNLTRFTKKKDE